MSEVSSLEVFDAVKLETGPMDWGASFAIHPADLSVLFGLKPCDLVSRNYDFLRAEEVSAALFKGDTSELEAILGVRFERAFKTKRIGASGGRADRMIPKAVQNG
jgi:hypothetical protein